jgi:hypothetical protein
MRWIAGTASPIAGAVDLPELEQHGARAPRERGAERSELNAARQPPAERHAEYVLHLGDHARGGGLRDVEHMRGRADLPAVLDRHDHAHMADLQRAAQQAFGVFAQWLGTGKIGAGFHRTVLSKGSAADGGVGDRYTKIVCRAPKIAFDSYTE